MSKLTQTYVRKEVHRHNSFQGAVRMAESNMRSIMLAETVTLETEKLASELYLKLGELRNLLKTRNDSHATRREFRDRT